ncbi:MAG TPA: RNA polymerase sigma factor [Anaeromyxobacter sp.]
MSVGDAQSDEDLVRLSAGGDARAFEALVVRHGDALFRFASRTCASERDGEDALQDGLLAAWRGAGTYRGEASARTWLFQVVINACRRRRRRRAGEPERHDPMEAAASLPVDQRGADERVAAAELGAALERALETMDDDARELLLLRDVEGLTGEETASALGIGLAAMKSRLHRARLELKERVEAMLRPGGENGP